MTRKFATVDGGSVEFNETSGGYDVHTRNAAGETISTVILREDDAGQFMRALLAAR